MEVSAAGNQTRNRTEQCAVWENVCHHLVMRKVKPSKVLSEKFQDCLLSVFVAELTANFEGQLLVHVSEELVDTRSTELNLNRQRSR